MTEVDLGYSPSAIAEFNGTRDDEVPYSAKFNPPDFTIEMWIEFQGGLGYRAILTSVSGSESEGRRGYLFCINPAGQWQFWLGSGIARFPWVILCGPFAQSGVWTHLAGTYDSQTQTATFYLNGAIVDQRQRIQFQPNAAQPLHVGAGATHQSGASPCFFHGRIARVRLWDETLSGEEIYTLAACASSAPAEPEFKEPEPPLGAENAELPQQSVLILNGQSDRIQLPRQSIPGGDEITVSFWTFGEGSANQNGSAIAAFDRSGVRSLNIHLSWDSSWVGFECGSDPTGTQRDRIEQTLLEPNPNPTWTHWAFTKSATTGEMNIYRNGELWQSGRDKTLPLLPPQTVFVGNSRPHRKGYQGIIRELRIWNTARSRSDIQADFNGCLRGNEPGLIGYWSLNEGEGSAVYDKTDNCNHGSIHGGKWKTLRVPQTCSISAAKDSPRAIVTAQKSGLQFDGIDDYIALKNPFSNPRRFTISLWVKPTMLEGGWQGIIGDSGREKPHSPGLALAPKKGALHYDSWEADGSAQYAGTLDGFFVARDRWVYLTWVKEETEYRFYRNGELVAIEAAPDMVYTSSTYFIGRGDNYFAGSLRYVRIWDIVCSLAEIRRQFAGALPAGEAGLSHYWPLDEGEGTIVTDSAARPHPGQIIGATWGRSALPLATSDSHPDELQPVLCFDGEDDYVEIGDPFENPTTFTISLWIKPAQRDNAPYSYILGKRWWRNYFKPELWIVPQTRALFYQTHHPSDPDNRDMGTLPNFFHPDPGEWVHIAWVKAGREYRFYRNGELYATHPASDRFYTAAHTSYWLGKIDTGRATIRHFCGAMSEVRIWRIARSESEIRADMKQRLTGNEAGLAYYWPLNEGTGELARDLAHPGNDGTICGATWTEMEVPIASWEAPAPVQQFQQPAIAFDGADDYIKLDNPFANDTTFTISLWVKPATLDDGAWHGILGKRGFGEDCAPALSLCPYDRALYYHLGVPGVATPDADVLIDFFPAVQSWVHITWVKDGGESRFYRNGDPVAKKPAPDRFSRPQSDYWVGKLGGRITQTHESFFAGKMAEVRIWSVARTEAEIRADLNRRLTGDEEGLSYYLPLNEGEGEMLGDRASHPGRAKLVGATWTEVEVPIS
ncbi:LamG domain-containing protein [Phormidium sp. CCY1219]|uniref:LamG domain-containing protein n=1 Tax=Phormidium sp. CCY1219 TaxID=2886104 RepID=UPI002D1F80E0|nr:LamG domain-containing protein [Phormidium sp. CCY1219]MEB3829296.1 LamG domain-containing protein [Phormidium sp. CCY1219]